MALTAKADDGSPLFILARQYEAAVEQFERIVLSVPGIDRADEKLVDRLDDRVARFRLAAKNPRYLNRLFNEWREVQKLHAQVEQRIFGKYTPNHELIYGWEVVAYQQSLFAEEFLYHVENPRHGNSVRRIPASNTRRDQFFRSTPALPPRPISLRPPAATR